ncbi:DUF2934 domain-containing protein [Pseudomonas purpurea]|uniref:DUF2934 domain-containing protein n=1 Tax=Pseudomonas purpurea TaxID=3136737 RepID=UPI00326343FA
MSTDEKRVREFAYQIWESEGKPEGQEARHWEMAHKLAEAEALAPSKPSTTGTGKAAPRKTAEPKTKARTKAAAVTSVVAKPGEKSAEPKKPRAPRKPPAR